MNIQKLTKKRFRQELAGIAASTTDTTEITMETIDACSDFLAVLPKFYSDGLDRLTMWTRIFNGIKSSLAKANGSVDRFVSEMLDYIKANPQDLYPDSDMLKIINLAINSKNINSEELLSCFETRGMLLVPLAREKWNDLKSGGKK